MTALVVALGWLLGGLALWGCCDTRRYKETQKAKRPQNVNVKQTEKKGRARSHQHDYFA